MSIDLTAINIAAYRSHGYQSHVIDLMSIDLTAINILILSQNGQSADAVHGPKVVTQYPLHYA